MYLRGSSSGVCCSVMSLSCKHCDCDNYREELMGNAMMISSEGNCKNCQHPVNAHPRSAAQQQQQQQQQQQPLVHAASVVSAAVVHPGDISVTKGQIISSGTESFISSSSTQPVQLPPSTPLDHSGSHIPQYDPRQGGYVTGTGRTTDNECTQGNYNNMGGTGPGVNNTVKSTGSVAYGGAYGSQYEGEYYSAKRISQETTLSSAPPTAVEVKVTSSNSNEGSGFDYDALRAQYGNGYSAKRIN